MERRRGNGQGSETETMIEKIRMKKDLSHLTIEEYDYFLKNPYYDGFTKHQLNQDEMYEALSSMDFSQPQRSTLGQKLLPYDSALTLEQVNEDLQALGWHEWPVDSIQTLNPQMKQDDAPSGITGAGGLSENLAVSSFKIRPKKLKPMKRRIAVASEPSDANAFSLSSFTIRRKRQRRSSKRTKKVNVAQDGGGVFGSKSSVNAELPHFEPVIVNMNGWQFDSMQVANLLL